MFYAWIKLFVSDNVFRSIQYLLYHIPFSFTHLQPFAIAKGEGFVAGDGGNEFSVDDMTAVDAVEIAAGEFLLKPMQYLGYRKRVLVGKIHFAIVAAGFNTDDVFGQHGLMALVGGNNKMCHINFVMGACLYKRPSIYLRMVIVTPGFTVTLAPLFNRKLRTDTSEPITG